MASCECCWADYSARTRWGGQSVEYSDVVTEHQQRDCVCSQNTPEGARLRAGQFWDEERQRDKREGGGDGPSLTYTEQDYDESMRQMREGGGDGDTG